MKAAWPLAALALAFVPHAGFAAEPPARTALDDYVTRPDDSYSWRIADTRTADGITTMLVDMVSQRWLTADDVDRTEWRHWLWLSIPDAAASNTALLFIAGGSNNREPPREPNARTTAIAEAANTVVAELLMVPNQPLVFHGDGKPRSEDDLIGYAWDQFLETEDARWAVRGAMVKSAVRAMDTVTAAMATEAGGERVVDRFVVAGGSKRGWTTWLTGAMDDRVVAIAPIVIDVLNVDASMRHHFAAYGFWAPSVADYVAHGIMRRLDHPRLAALYRLVDPFYYRHRLLLPKFVLNAAGDQFFLPDSSQFYWPDLQGEKYLRYVPNADHGLDGTDAVESLAAFHGLIAQQRKPPQFTWRRDDDGTLHVAVHDHPQEARLWQATNPDARDFRVESLGRRYVSTRLAAAADGGYSARVPPPPRGWTAWFIELTFDVGAAVPLKLTTEVVVTPNTLPFASKPAQRPPSITAHCAASSAALAARIASEAETAGAGMAFAADGIVARTSAERVYLNWTPAGDFSDGARQVGGFLAERRCGDVAYQLESGPETTMPPTKRDR